MFIALPAHLIVAYATFCPAFLPIANRDRPSGWIKQLVKLSYSTSVSASDTVLIFVEIMLDRDAHSSHAKVDVDFKTGAERRIRVPLIQMRYL
jgi:hypothetical protein